MYNAPMRIKREIAIIGILIVVILSLYSFTTFFKKNVEQTDASKFVLEDIAEKYPNANVTIIEIKEKLNSYNEKYFEVKAGVTFNKGTRCPELYQYYYNYPVQNFVASPPEKITSGCTVCTNTPCQIAFEEEAAIASHSFSGTENVNAYIQNNSAKYQVTEKTASWKVKWDSTNATDYYEVEVGKNGSILTVVRIPKKG